MTSITRAVTARDLTDLLTSARFAVIAWRRDGRVAAGPAAFRYANGRYHIGVPEATLTDHAEVAVLVDDGPLYFDLRGVRIRGRIQSSLHAPESGDELEWFEVEPAREVAWHYGTLRERP